MSGHGIFNEVMINNMQIKRSQKFKQENITAQIVENRNTPKTAKITWFTSTSILVFISKRTRPTQLYEEVLLSLLRSHSQKKQR